MNILNKKSRIFVIIACITVAFAMVFGIISNNTKSNPETSGSLETVAMLGGTSDNTEGRLLLDVGDITEILVDYTIRIPINEIINNEPGFEEYYYLLIQTGTQWLDGNPTHPFQGDSGFFISTHPIYMLDIYTYKMHDLISVVLLSENLENSAEAVFYIFNDEVHWNGRFEFYPLRLMMQNPNERYIFLFNNLGTLILDSNNKIHQWARQQHGAVEVRGDYYNVLNHTLLGVSYNDLINPEKLIWIELNNN